MANERTSEMPGVWAINAVTTIPVAPIPGVAYRLTSTPDSYTTTGAEFDRLADSARWNDAYFRITEVLDEVDKKGILGWNELIAYPGFPSVVRGSDEILYRSTAPSTGVDPVGDGTGTWITLIQVSDDTSPQLSGDLDVRNFAIIDSSGGSPNQPIRMGEADGEQMVFVHRRDNVERGGRIEFEGSAAFADLYISNNGGTIKLGDSDVENHFLEVAPTGAPGVANLIVGQGLGDIDAGTVSGNMVATPAQVAAGILNDVVLTPLNLLNGPTVPKKYVLFNQTGALSVTASFGVSSVTDNGVGLATPNFSGDFANTSYGCIGWARDNDATGDMIVSGVSGGLKSVAGLQVATTQSSGTKTDSPEVFLTFTGDLA